MKRIALFSWLNRFDRLASRNAAQRLPAQKPNVLVIVVDDLGYADIGLQKSKDTHFTITKRIQAGEETS
jgi:hypothetical protein